jgi:hypothetical protein
MTQLLLPPPADRQGWIRIGYVVTAVVAGVVVLLLLPRLFGLYWLYWGQGVFRDLFHDDIGLSEDWASTLGTIAAVFYALAMLHLMGRSTWQLLSRRVNLQQLSLWLARYFFVFASPHAIRGIAAAFEDACFNRAGEPVRWYVQSADGRVLLYNTPGHDGAGNPKQPVTRQICDTVASAGA